MVQIRTAHVGRPGRRPPTQVVGNATLVNGQTEIKLAAAQPSQYILVWITTLAGGGATTSPRSAKSRYLQAR